MMDSDYCAQNYLRKVTMRFYPKQSALTVPPLGGGGGCWNGNLGVLSFPSELRLGPSFKGPPIFMNEKEAVAYTIAA
jgi:hypothetical protein